MNVASAGIVLVARHGRARVVCCGSARHCDRVSVGVRAGRCRRSGEPGQVDPNNLSGERNPDGWQAPMGLIRERVQPFERIDIAADSCRLSNAKTDRRRAGKLPIATDRKWPPLLNRGRTRMLTFDSPPGARTKASLPSLRGKSGFGQRAGLCPPWSRALRTGSLQERPGLLAFDFGIQSPTRPASAPLDPLGPFADVACARNLVAQSEH